ncbi:MAG: hypothetical protein KIT89_00995 [Microcella sp.]|uniref:hypothetical protein n=1 Tax=Microcella sp. TaxID=1913979 RepID=UPI0024C550C8|nr:hypothetical protein [Microcella sp.]UYN83849.1 MAG: hypothetical protein KIT89_00995 [Microcella sp.]
MTVSSSRRDQFEAILGEIDGFPDADRQEVLLLVEHNEDELALELLATQVYEFELSMGQPAFAKLENLAKSLAVSDRLLQLIREELVV